MDKFSSKVHRVHMELGGKLLNSLRIKTQFLERLQSVSVVDGVTHTQEDDVESDGGSLENVAEILVLFFCGKNAIQVLFESVCLYFIPSLALTGAHANSYDTGATDRRNICIGDALHLQQHEMP